jgi:hypothetical protein
MPHILRFHDNDEGPSTLPDPAAVGHAAAWAGERGYWDVATCLMELAHALAEAESPAPVNLPGFGESALTYALATPHEAAHRCEHNYLTRGNVHLSSGGVCDLSAGNGA